MSTLNNKVAIVTGSTSGIGEGIAKMLSDAGANVVINSVSSIDKGKKLANELSHAIYIQGNIYIEKDCENIINETINHFGQLDILVNSAGKLLSPPSDNILDISNQMFSESLESNVVGTWCLIRYAIPYLKKTGDGNIVNITSCAAMDPASAAAAIPYSVAKAAINYLTKLLSKHCGPEIRVNAIAPGMILTPRTEKFPQAINEFKEKTPLKRVGQPKDIAELVLAIIKSNYINGEIILADGGFSTM